MEPYDIHKKTADPPGPPVHMPHFKRSDECAVGIALLPGRILMRLFWIAPGVRGRSVFV